MVENNKRNKVSRLEKGKKQSLKDWVESNFQEGAKENGCATSEEGA